jgi:hypothetical protein
MKSISQDGATIVKNISEKIGGLYTSQQSKINVSIWLKTEDGKEQIINLYDVYADPFKLGETLHIDVEEIPPLELRKYRIEHQAHFQTENTKKRDLVGRKRIKLISREVYVKTKYFDKDRIEIEYFAELTETPN